MNPRPIRMYDKAVEPEMIHKVFKAPPAMENCVDLETLVDPEPFSEVILSFWKPTDMEMAVLQAGGSVRLTIYGSQLPPVALGVTDVS